MKLISITLASFFPQDLAKEIVKYLIRKKIKSVTIICLREMGRKIEKKIEIKHHTKYLSDFLENCMNNEGVNFYMDIPEIKTTFEEFAYGIEANSYEGDFGKYFSKYTSD